MQPKKKEMTHAPATFKRTILDIKSVETGCQGWPVDMSGRKSPRVEKSGCRRFKTLHILLIVTVLPSKFGKKVKFYPNTSLGNQPRTPLVEFIYR